MKKPVIVLSPSYDPVEILPAFHNYAVFDSNCNAIAEAGGIPVIAPYLKEKEDIAQLVEQADGVFLTGGCDVVPASYGEETRPCCDAVCPERDEFELALIQEALRQDKPLLCICRGSQILNVAFGGTLYQDLKTDTDTAVDHTNYQKYLGDAHDIKVEKDSHLYRTMEQEVMTINSLHHQGIKDLGEGLRAVGVAPDGLVEALEVPGKKYAVAYQWHPEMMAGSDQYYKLFASFVETCKGE